MKQKLLYLIPDTRVISLQHGLVLCTSGDGFSNEGYGRDEIDLDEGNN